MTDLTAVSLFGGIGGFDKALEDSGVQVVATVEIDAACRGILAGHFPGSTLLNDVTEVTSEQLIAAGFVPRRGILAGGWPCQDLSIAGRRAGLGGARSGLFWHVVRLADELRPQWLVFENVPGLLSAVCSCPGDGACTANGRAVRCGEWRTRTVAAGVAGLGTECPICGDGWEWHDAGGFCARCHDTCEGLPEAPTERYFAEFVPHGVKGGACAGGCMPAHGGAMGTVLGALGKLGYGFAYRVLDAQFFGVPQRRKRVFIVGCLGDRAGPVEVLLEPEGGAGNPAARRAPGQDVAGTLGSRAGGSRTTDLDGHGAYVTGALTAGSLTEYDDNTARAGFMVAHETGAGWWTEGPGTLRADGGGGTGRGDHLVVASTLQGGGRRGHRVDAEGAAGGHLIPFDTAQITHAENRSNLKPGDPAPTLNGNGQLHIAPTLRSHPRPGSADPGAVVSHPITSREARRSADSDATNGLILAATLTSGAHGPGVSAPGRRHEDQENLVVTHALTSEGADASEDGTGRGTVTRGVPRPVPSSLAVAGDFSAGEDVAQTVRRLTPRECERLQGFPDDWTRWLADGTEQSDSARYRQCGNAVAVPVVRWIAERLVAVDAAEDPGHEAIA